MCARQASNPSRQWTPPRVSTGDLGGAAARRRSRGQSRPVFVSEEEEREPARLKRYDFEYLVRESDDPKRRQSAAAQRAMLLASKKKGGDDEKAAKKAAKAAARAAKRLSRSGNSSDNPYEINQAKRTLGQQAGALARLGAEKTRGAAIWAVQQRWFDGTILALIVLGTMLLAVDSARLEKDVLLGEASAVVLAQVLYYINVSFTAIFIVEMLVKMAAFSLCGYFEDGWNWLDFFIVIISVIGLMDFLPALKSLRALRALRALRPLRLVSRYPEMQLVVEAIFQAAPSILNVVLVLLLFWLVFGILGVQFFGGMMHWCVLYVPPVLTGGDHLLVPMQQYRNKSSCEQYGAELAGLYHSGPSQPPSYGAAAFGDSLCLAGAARPEAVCQLLWRRHAPGFDSVPEALLTLFEIATLQGWPIIMHLASDAQGKDLAPRQEGPPGFQGAELYFLLFIVLGAFIFMKLFAGAAIDPTF